jgi:AMMECR1 domain-containing protein
MSDAEASDAMVRHCFDTLVSKFRGEAPPPFTTPSVAPVFVTLNIIERDGSLSLRGCIGTLSPVPLSCLGDYALKSAFEDRRFPPLRESEMPQLDVGISLLTNFEECAHCEDWEVSVHLSFSVSI